MTKKKLTAVIAACAVVVVVLAVILISMLTKGDTSHSAVNKDAQFVTGTTINGQDVSGLTAEQAKEALAKAPDTYTFTLTMGEKVYRVTGAELKLTYNEQTDLSALLAQQEKDSTQTAFTVENLYTLDLTALKDQVTADFGGTTAAAETAAEGDAAASAVASQAAEGEDAALTPTEDPNAAKNAYLKYDEDQQLFTIVPDEPGTAVDTDKVMEQVQTAVIALSAELTLDMTQFAQQAEVKADSEALKAALEDANSRLDMKLTYTFTPDGGSTSTVTIDRATLGSFFCASADGQSVEVDEEVLGNYVADLVSKYSVAGKSTPFKTTGGGTININIATAGQSVDSEKLYNDMLNCLKNKTSGTRTAPYSAKSDDSSGYWGGNYVEIDQTSQHLWLYKNGKVIVSCDIVSGNVANNTRTPNGCFTIFAKNTDRYLQGSNTDGSRYKTWVSYFMPFSGGCGIHDATWRSVFGGTVYYYSGSHGCVGVTLSNAKTIYNNVSVGTHVVVYGGISKSQLPSTSPTMSAVATEVTIAVGESLDLGFQTNSDGAKTFGITGGCISIDDNGVITGVKEGSCYAAMHLDATSNFAEGQLNVLVHVVPKTASDQNASASIGTNSLTVGDTTAVSVSGNQTSASFSSSNSSVASVDGNGNITAVGAGSATITVTCPGNDSWNAWSKSFSVTVSAKAPEQKDQNISASAPSHMTEGTSASISVSGAHTALSFSSSDSSIITVDGSGNIVAAGVGTATITVTCAETSEYKSASTTCTITVQAKEDPQPDPGSGSSARTSSTSVSG